jgi:hypothetical protein
MSNRKHLVSAEVDTLIAATKGSRLSPSQRDEFLEVPASINLSRNKQQAISEQRSYRAPLEHYYPGGKVTQCL